jgi:hypothetical protein
MSQEVTSEFAGLSAQVRVGFSLFHITFVTFEVAKTNLSAFTPREMSF